MEAPGIHSRRHHHRAAGHKAVVAAVLLLRLLLRARDHQGRLRQGALLGINPAADGVGVLDLVVGHASGQQTALLLTAEGMTGKQQGNAQPLRHQGAHVTGIGVVGMNPVGTTLLRGDMRDHRIRQLIEMGPEQLLAQITARAAGQAHDAGSTAQLLTGLGVIGRHALVVNQPGDHLNPVHLRPSRQATHQLQHVGGLPTGISITPQFEVVTTKQTVQMQMKQIETHPDLRRLAQL